MKITNEKLIIHTAKPTELNQQLIDLNGLQAH